MGQSFLVPMPLNQFTLSNAIFGATLPGGGQTFVIGGDFYQPIFINPQILMRVSTDSGATWNTLGGTDNNFNPPIATAAVGTKIFCIGNRTAPNVITAHIFDTGSSTWSHVDSVISTTALTFLQILSSAFIQSDGVLVAGLAIANGPGGILRTFYMRFDTVGLTWIDNAFQACGITSGANPDDCLFAGIVSNGGAGQSLFIFASGAFFASASADVTLWNQTLSGGAPGVLTSFWVEAGVNGNVLFPFVSSDGTQVLVTLGLGNSITCRAFVSALPGIAFAETDLNGLAFLVMAIPFQDSSTTTGMLFVLGDVNGTIISFHNQLARSFTEGTLPIAPSQTPVFGPFTPSGTSSWTLGNGGIPPTLVVQTLIPGSAPPALPNSNAIVETQILPAIVLPDPHRQCMPPKKPLLKGTCQYGVNRYK